MAVGLVWNSFAGPVQAQQKLIIDFDTNYPKASNMKTFIVVQGSFNIPAGWSLKAKSVKASMWAASGGLVYEFSPFTVDNMNNPPTYFGQNTFTSGYTNVSINVYVEAVLINNITKKEQSVRTPIKTVTPP